MTRRILTVLLAIVLAVIGTGAVLVYVNGANNRALDGQQPVTVLVAAQQIPAGTSAGLALREGLLVREQVPAKSVQGTDYVGRLSPALGLLVVSADIPSGELLLRPMLVTQVTASSGIAIPRGEVAVTIALCVPQAVAGYVGPGAQVAIFDTTGNGSGGCTAGGAGSSSSTSGTAKAGSSAPSVSTKIVLPKVTVLAIGQAPAPQVGSATSTAYSQSSTSDSSSTGSVLVTLAVDQSDAERVISLAESGLPYLALLGQQSVTGPDHGSIPLFPR